VAEREQQQRLVLLLGSLTGHLAAAITEAVGPELSSSANVATLFYLDLEGARRPGALQDVTGLSSGGVSKLIDRLEGQGLVRRTFGPVDGDRRAVLVQLTPKGRRLARRMADAAQRCAEEQRVYLKQIVTLADL
jgi:DNA-binding MarR family transcriptional regulator